MHFHYFGTEGVQDQGKEPESYIKQTKVVVFKLNSH